MSYNDHDSMLLQLTAAMATNPSVAERQAACEVLSKLSWIRRTLTPAAAAILDAMIAAADGSPRLRPCISWENGSIDSNERVGVFEVGFPWNIRRTPVKSRALR